MNHSITRSFVIIAILSIACTLPFPIKSETLKLATMAPEGSIWMQQIDALNKELTEISKGQITFKIYPGGIMGDDDVVLRKIRVGQLDGALFTTNALSKLDDDIYLLTYPGVFLNDLEVDHFLQTQSEFFVSRLQSKGFEVLGIMSLGFTYAYSTFPIQDVSDMKNAKAWLWDNDQVMNAMYSKLGVAPITVSISDVMTALQTGLLNMVFNTPAGIVSMQWFTRVKYMLDFPLTHSFGAFIVKTPSWEKIPDDLKPVIKNLVQKYTEGITLKNRNEDEKARTILQSRGITVQAPTPEFSANLRSLFTEVRADLLPPNKTDAYQTIYSVVDNFRTNSNQAISD
ncbi:MAG: TRAP transporter substrate-binding protein DctP [bacterium]